MDDILTKLGLNSRITIGVSVSANNTVEMLCVDKPSRTIIKYAAKELKYNTAIREIIDYDELSLALSDLFRELNLNPKNCNIVLNLPNVHFGFINLPLILPDDQIKTAIASEVEQLYLFKRHEPVISWNTVDENKESDKRTIVYSAIQEMVLNNLKEVFEELGAKLIAIENSYSSLIKGIQFSRIMAEEMSAGSSINVLLISTNSYAIFSLSGNKIIDYFEEPLAIKSFTNEEVYLAISSAASTTLANYPTQNLLLISETDEVSAELLSDKINFTGNKKYLDTNKYAKQPFIDTDFSVLQNYVPMISIEGVGAATYQYESYSLKFNFLADTVDSAIPQALTVTLFGREIEIDRKAIFTILAIIITVLLILLTVVGLSLKYFNEKLASEIAVLNQEQQTLEAKIKESKISVDVADIYTTTQQIYTENMKEFALFNAISMEIPNEVWLETFYANSDGEVFISGKSVSSDNIYPFFKGLKAVNPDLFLSKLEMDSNSPLTTSNDSIYYFEITSTKNKSDSMDWLNTGQKPEGAGEGAVPAEGQQANPGGSNLPAPGNPEPAAMPAPPQAQPTPTGPPPISSAP